MVTGVAQDSVAGNGTVTVLDTASVSAALDAGSRLTSAGGDLPAEAAAALIGRSPVSGFRKGLARLAAAGLDPGSPQAAILDDLPAVRLISGYARLMEHRRPSPRGGQRRRC